MALLTLTSTLVGWYNLRFISQVEKDNTQALIPTMNMARQLSEASAWELFAAQNLTSADNEKMWQAQGRMLTAQSLKINALLQALREQGFVSLYGPISTICALPCAIRQNRHINLRLNLKDCSTPR